MELYPLFIALVQQDPADFIIFLGRFHPLVVHLPIGFLILAVITQVAVHWPKFDPLRPFIPYAWALGALSAAFAVLFGYFLSLSGDYDPDALFLHKWSGIGVLLISLICYYSYKKYPKMPKMISWTLVALVATTLGYTGHMGGNLTHGSTYLLEYAPNPLRNLAGMPPKTIARKKVEVIDSADVFLDLVQPMMTNKCVSCHNSGKKKGKLLLTDYSGMMKGGESGEVLIPGDVESSEFFRRITLPETHDDFMPSEGKRPLSEQEVALLEWWISVGCPPEGYIPTLEIDKETIALANAFFGLDKNRLLSQQIEAANTKIIDSLQKSGFVVNRLMMDNYFLEANYRLSERDITDADLELLGNITDQLVWLDLSNSNLKNAQLLKIGGFKNLIKLNLSGNTISDEGLLHLAQLTQLETINLYQTEVSDGILELLPKLTRLKSIYLWKTKLNDSVAVKLRDAHKNIKVIMGRETNLEDQL